MANNKKTIKVLHILDGVARGGLETLELDLSRNASSYGLDLIFVVCRKGDLFDEFKNSGVPFYYFHRKWPLDPLVLLKLIKLIRKEKINLIHVHQDVTAVHGYIVSVLTRTKIVQSIHGFSDKRSCSGKLVLKSYLSHKIASYLFHKTFCVSHYLKRELIKQGYCAKKLKVLYNGIDFKRIGNPKTKIQFSGLKERKKFVFGMVGNFNYVRNHKILLEAFARLEVEKPNVNLKLAGKGELFEPMKKYAQRLGIGEKVEFLGSISNLPEFFNRIDCFVYSSRSDTFGIAVVEAMYSKLPVIVSDNGPFPELTENGKYANLFKANDVNSLFLKMREMIEQYEKKRFRLTEIKDKIVNRFCIENYIKQLKLEYSEIL